MTTYRLALLQGDGIGPEISAATLGVLDAVSERFPLKFDIRPSPAGDAVLQTAGAALPDDSIKTIGESDACIKGPVGQSAADVIVRLRQMFKLYANVRPSKSLPGVECLRPDIDLVIVRENTEDLYRGMEFGFGTGAEEGVVALRLITREASERIARYAFELARSRGGPRRVVSVHKSNVLRKGDALFAQACKDVAASYPTVQLSEMLVDAAAMNLIRSPESFDVIVTTNLYGDILSDEAAQLVGGLGLAASANIGDRLSLFEPVHGSAPDIAGRGIANPVSMILSAAMMLGWLAGSRGDSVCAEAGDAIGAAVRSILQKGVKTPDLGGNRKTSEVGEAVAAEIRGA